MITKEEVAKKYLFYLEKSEMDRVINLFTKDGVVTSPLYGTQPAKTFYKKLADDTNSSKLKFDGLFFEENSNRISLLFDYQWELKNGKKVEFKVVDIIELNVEHKIKKLTIIYDTIHSKPVTEGLA